MLQVLVQQPVYIIADALDECPDMSGIPTPRETVLSLVENLVQMQHPYLHVCVTSRQEIGIKDVLEPLAYSAVSLHDENYFRLCEQSGLLSQEDAEMAGWREEARCQRAI